MLDFDSKLKKILTEDPLGILKTRIPQPITSNQRLNDSFEKINDFIDKNKKEPSESVDINERKLFSRLKELRKDFDKMSILNDLDRHNLFKDVKEIKTVDDILENDVLGLLEDDSENIFNIKNIPKKKAKTDFVARRKPCKDFSKYEDNFKLVQSEIKRGNRKLIIFKENHLKEGRYYILDGILVYLEKIEEKKIKIFNDKAQGSRNRVDPRTKCIFENGLESNMYLRSLQKELYNNGSTIIQSNEDDLLKFDEGFGKIDEKDKLTGNIYILSSLSEKPEIKSIKDLYKIGYCTTSIEKRIENADKDPTFLMAPVKIVSSYKIFNLPAQKFESLVHSFFYERCLDIKIADKTGSYKKPKEWYIVPIRAVEQSIELIINNEIQNYKFDHLQNRIVNLIIKE